MAATTLALVVGPVGTPFPAPPSVTLAGGGPVLAAPLDSLPRLAPLFAALIRAPAARCSARTSRPALITVGVWLCRHLNVNNMFSTLPSSWGDMASLERLYVPLRTLKPPTLKLCCRRIGRFVSLANLTIAASYSQGPQQCSCATTKTT
jgi:hypothetical protein